MLPPDQRRWGTTWLKGLGRFLRHHQGECEGFSGRRLHGFRSGALLLHIFSLPAILVLILTLVGTVMNPSDVRGGFEGQLQSLMGPSAGEQVRNHHPAGGAKAAHAGVCPRSSASLGCSWRYRRLWAAAKNAQPDLGRRAGSEPGRHQEFPDRAALLLRDDSACLAFFLLVSLVISAALTGIGGRLGSFLPAGVFGSHARGASIRWYTLGVITLLFAAMFKVMPDARISVAKRLGGRRGNGSALCGGQVPDRILPGEEQSRGRRTGRPGRSPCCCSGSTTPLSYCCSGRSSRKPGPSVGARGIEPEPGAVRVRP